MSTCLSGISSRSGSQYCSQRQLWELFHPFISRLSGHFRDAQGPGRAAPPGRGEEEKLPGQTAETADRPSAFLLGVTKWRVNPPLPGTT